MNSESVAEIAPLVDQYGNLHYLSEEIARGGQGIVFRTRDGDLAIKQPLNAGGGLDASLDLQDRFQNVRLLPIPRGIPVSLPLAILRDESGYVMRLLSDMKPFSVFNRGGETKKELIDQGLELPEWLSKIPDIESAYSLFHYADTGSARCRLHALSQCAAILARIHNAGLVYGDISPNNAFVGNLPTNQVWLIDADNLRFEIKTRGSAVYSPGYGAPELVRGESAGRPRTDCWAFAVMAFELLALCHPFIGKRVLEPDPEGCGWDSEPIEDEMPTDLDDQAYAGFFPFIDDEDDDSNQQASSALPRELVLTQALRTLFQETFGAGRTQAHRRTTMAIWAIELTKAYDLSIDCLDCNMSYFADEHTKCPYCGDPRPDFIRVQTSRWTLIVPGNTKESMLPNRLFDPFSYENYDKVDYEVVFDFSKETVSHVRGTKPLPDGVMFDFEEVAS